MQAWCQEWGVTYHVCDFLFFRWFVLPSPGSNTRHSLPLPQNTRYLKEETTVHPHLLIFLFIYLHFILFFYAISSSLRTRKITEKILKRIKHKNKYLLIGRGNYIYFYTVGSSRCQTRIWNLNFQGRPPTLEILGQHNILSIIWPCA